ncbi:MAG: M14 family zinc carboxypeptidase, partial [Longimicrobiales bacterium]
MRFVSLALILLLWSDALAAQHPFATGGQYDPSVPAPRTVLGYEVGERFTPHHVLARYFESVAAASPRVRLDTLGHSFEGREVLLAVVTSEANQQRIDEILAASGRVADPRGASPAELDAAVRSLPGIVWLAFTVHGGEASGVEAAIALLYQLAAGGDADTRLVLDSTVVLIDPVQNPDGHERHVQDVMRMRGSLGVPATPGAMIHSGNWPGPRTSHYYFDLNRDWFILSHPETRAQLSSMTRWWPHVAVDLHEMGSSSTYFFAPPMEPINQNVHTTVRKWWQIYAESNAAAFDRHGWSFFTREGYDEFYPGYGPSWPIFAGAAGMTYEQASSSGGAIRRSDGTVMTLRDAAHHHYTAAFATALATAQRRTERVRDFLEFRTSAISDGQAGPMRSIVIARDVQGRADSLIVKLLSSGIEVGRLQSATEVRGATAFGSSSASTLRAPAGAYVIDLAQPQGRLVKALLEPDAQLDSSFIADELERRRTGQGNRFYDITAWALPYLFRVDAWWTGSSPGPAQPVT